MTSKDTVEIIRHYRHDWMNLLQLLHGYASMNNLDKVKEKINEGIALSREETRLTNLNCPYFSLWVIRFNWIYSNLRLKYNVQAESINLSNDDLALYGTCEDMIQILEYHTDSKQLYEGTLLIEGGQAVLVTFTFEGLFLDIPKLTTKLKEKLFVEDVIFTNTDTEDMTCMIRLSIENKR